jgi:glycosyltransferase involved in cell wall biosynthesis
MTDKPSLAIPTIVHVIDSLSLGGAETLLKNTIALLPQFRHTIICLEKRNKANNIIINYADIISLGFSGWKSLPASVIKLRKIINKIKPLLVHSHLFYATICARLATGSGVPLVSTIHSLYSKDAFEKNKKSIWAERLLFKKEHSLIAVSKYVLDDYLKYIPFKGKQYVLYNFLPDEMYLSNKTLIKKDGVKFIALGNLKEAKNYRYLLEVFKYLKPFNISLDIYGKGPEQKQLAKIIKTNHLKVRLCGTADNIPKMMQAYDYFIQSSSHEGFGLSVIEAMAAGVPVILSDIPVFREITNGLASFFPLNDPLHAAQLIRQNIENVMDTIKLSLEAARFVKERYSAERYRNELLSIYSEITGNTISTFDMNNTNKHSYFFHSNNNL